MISPRMFAPLGARLGSFAAGCFLLSLGALHGCNESGGVAGGSSEVDNPVVVALVDENGSPVTFTGSLSVYVSDQNPAIDPDPLLEVQVSGDSVIKLSATHFKKLGDSTRFNLLARGATTGALLDSFAYDTLSRRLTVKDSSASRLRVSLVPLVRYSASVSLDADGPERVFIPGTPYQSVVVADSFVFADVPSGKFPLRVYSSEGVEREFPKPVDTREKDHFSIDTAAPPIPRPPQPGTEFFVAAGADQSVFANSEIFLSGQLTGISANDKRVAILWRQLFTGPQDAWAYIHSPSSLNTKVGIMWPGVYRFILSVSMGRTRMEDTVVIGAQTSQPQFYEPWDSTQYFIGYPANVKWYNYGPDTLDVQFSRDSGATWQTIVDNTIAVYGFNQRQWMPTGNPSANCYLRLRNNAGTITARSGRFKILNWTY